MNKKELQEENEYLKNYIKHRQEQDSLESGELDELIIQTKRNNSIQGISLHALKKIDKMFYGDLTSKAGTAGTVAHEALEDIKAQLRLMGVEV